MKPMNKTDVGTAQRQIPVFQKFASLAPRTKGGQVSPLDAASSSDTHEAMRYHVNRDVQRTAALGPSFNIADVHCTLRAGH